MRCQMKLRSLRPLRVSKQPKSLGDLGDLGHSGDSGDWRGPDTHLALTTATYPPRLELSVSIIENNGDKRLTLRFGENFETLKL